MPGAAHIKPSPTAAFIGQTMGHSCAVTFTRSLIAATWEWAPMVSPQLREELGNGDAFYARAGTVISLPAEGSDWPEREFNKDPDFRNRSAVSDVDFGRLVRHVYKVLLTRGMVGTLLYSTDEQTRDWRRGWTQ